MHDKNHIIKQIINHKNTTGSTFDRFDDQQYTITQAEIDRLLRTIDKMNDPPRKHKAVENSECSAALAEFINNID